MDGPVDFLSLLLRMDYSINLYSVNSKLRSAMEIEITGWIAVTILRIVSSY
jgi:hypothetical protein